MLKVRSLSCVQLFATAWTIAYQALPSMGFSRQEYWCGLPFPFPGDLPDPGMEPRSPSFQADALTSAYICINTIIRSAKQSMNKQLGYNRNDRRI